MKTLGIFLSLVIFVKAGILRPPWSDMKSVATSMEQDYSKRFFSTEKTMMGKWATDFCKLRGLKLADVNNLSSFSVIGNLSDTNYWIAPAPNNSSTCACLKEGKIETIPCNSMFLQTLCMLKLPTFKETEGQRQKRSESGEIFETEIEEAETNPCFCGRSKLTTSQPVVIGGQNAAIGEFPWRCAVYFFQRGTFCGCTIINERWVMTAAHCLKDSGGEMPYIFYGFVKLEEFTSHYSEIDKVVYHENYNEDDISNDIGLLRVRGSGIKFDENIQPVCLPFSPSPLDNVKVQLSGWGLTNGEGNEIAGNLQKVELTAISNNDCLAKFPGYTPPIFEGNICAMDSNDSAGACNGDSGGSIDFKESNGLWYAIGVTSWVYAIPRCDTAHPTVFTRVTSYLNWIERNIKGTSLCRPVGRVVSSYRINSTGAQTS